MVKGRHQLLLAPNSRKVLFRPYNEINRIKIFDDDSLIPRDILHVSSARSCMLGVDLSSGDEVFGSPPSGFSDSVHQETAAGAFVDAKTGNVISKPDWFLISLI